MKMPLSSIIWNRRFVEKLKEQREAVKVLC